ncbi:MAG: STAS domain-containing protein [Clostridia bacterium]|nr:STAS domain-containing protein [Clostridia bacterium]
MIINKSVTNETLTLFVEGRLDTTTAPELEAALSASLSGINALVIDLAKLEYISSAGLRVILKAQKLMNMLGTMKLINVNESIMEVFEITGFVDILTIE